MRNIRRALAVDELDTARLANLAVYVDRAERFERFLPRGAMHSHIVGATRRLDLIRRARVRLGRSLDDSEALQRITGTMTYVGNQVPEQGECK